MAAEHAEHAPPVAGPSRHPSHLAPWFLPFALVNGSAVGLVPILLPIVSIKYGVGHVGLVMGTFNLGAFAAPLTGALADKFRAHRLLAVTSAAVSAVSLWLFPLVGPALQLLLALANGAGFAGAVTIASLLVVERSPKPQWNSRLGWLETALSVGQGGALLLASWLSTLSARNALLIGALVPAAAIPVAALLIRRVPAAAQAAAEATPVTPAATTDASSPVDHAIHHLAEIGHVGEWGPASPFRVHHLHQHHRPLAGARTLLRGGFGWMLAAWTASYAGTAIVFSLYAVLFSQSFGVPPQTSALAFAVIVFVSLPLFVLAGRVGQRRGPVPAMAGGMAVRVALLALLAVLAAVGHVPSFLPFTAFAGIMFAWSFLSVASPALTAQLAPGQEGDAQGLLNACSGLAGLVGSVAGGEVAAAWGFPAALALGAASVTVGLAIFVARVARRVGR
jgi:MFS transporter, DHA1 family, tetracycline resistance protein